MDSREYHKHHLPWVRRMSKHLPPGFDPLAQPGTYTHEYYEPNVVPWTTRVAYALLAITFLAYGWVGLLVGEIWIPGRRTSGITLTGTSVWIAVAAIAVGSAGLLSVILDHYDRRNNEQRYKRLQQVSRVLSLCLLVVAVLWHAHDLLDR